MIATPMGKAIFSAARWRPTFLLRDDFTTTASAPLSSPRTAEPGPGTLTITDGNSKLSVATGKLTFATGGVGQGDPGVWDSSLRTRLGGRAVLAKINYSAQVIDFGFDINQAAGGYDLFRLATTNLNIVLQGSVSLVVGTIASSTDYYLSVVMRSGGTFYFIKGGTFTNWTLAWIGVAGTVDFYPTVMANATTSVFTAANLRVLDLPAPFTSDYGLATQRLSGARSALDAFSHEANCLIEFTDTTRPSASNLDFRFRRQDATNYWQVTIDSTGAFTLNEVVAGTPTQRATAAAVVSSGHRVVIIADSTTIRGYSNNVLRWTYSSASNFATSTAGELTALGTSGVVNDIVSYPRTLTGTASAILDLAVA